MKAILLTEYKYVLFNFISFNPFDMVLGSEFLKDQEYIATEEISEKTVPIILWMVKAYHLARLKEIAIISKLFLVPLIVRERFSIYKNILKSQICKLSEDNLRMPMFLKYNKNFY
jgi:hypothetical protein